MSSMPGLPVDKLADEAAKLKAETEGQPGAGVDKVFNKLAASAANDDNKGGPKTSSPPDKPPPPPSNGKMTRREWVKKAGIGGLLALAWLAAGGAGYKAAEEAAHGVEKASEKVEEHYPEVSGQTAVNIIDAATMTYFLANMARLSTGKLSGIRPVDYAAMAGFLGARSVFGGPEVAHETAHTLSHAAKEAAAILVFATAVEGINVDLSKALTGIPNYAQDNAVQLAANFVAASMISPFFSTITSAAALQDELEKLFFKSGKLNKLLATIAIEHHANMSGATGIDGDPPTFHNIGVFGLKGAVALQTVYGLPLAAYSLVTGLYKANLATLLGPDDAKLETFKNPKKWLTLNPKLRAEAWENTRRGMKAVVPYMPAFMGHSLMNLAKYAANPFTGFHLQQSEKGLQMFLGERLKEAAANTFKVLAHADPRTEHRFTPGAHVTSELLADIGDSLTEHRKLELDPFAAKIEGLIKEAGQHVDDKVKSSQHVMALLEQALDAKDPDRRKAAYAALAERAHQDFGAEKSAEILQVAATLHAFQETLDTAANEPALKQSNPLAAAKRLTQERLELATGPAVFETVKTIGYQTMALPALSNIIGLSIKIMRASGMPETAMRAALLMAEWQVSKDADNWATHTGVSDGAAKEGLAIYGSSTNLAINGGAKKEDGNPGPTKKIIAATHGELKRADVAQGSLVHADSTVVSLGYSLALDAVDAERKLIKLVGLEHPADKNAPQKKQPHAPTPPAPQPGK